MATQRPKDEIRRRLKRLREPARPWHEAGWIFKNGEIIAIERNGGTTRSRNVAEDETPTKEKSSA